MQLLKSIKNFGTAMISFKGENYEFVGQEKNLIEEIQENL